MKIIKEVNIRFLNFRAYELYRYFDVCLSGLPLIDDNNNATWKGATSSILFYEY